MEIIRITIDGDPVSKGSHKSFGTISKGKIKTWVVDQHETQLQKLYKLVKKSVEGVENIPVDGPVKVQMVFHVRRPKTVRRKLPSVKPDIDKLARAINDALTGLVIKDDGQVCSLVAIKDYACKQPYTEVVVEEYKGESND